MIVLIVLIGAFFRLFKISAFTTFLGEQGRDMLIAKDILAGKLTLLGPPTSISDVHFGPFYHYFNALFLCIFKLNPIGPAIGFSLISIISIFLLFQTGKNFKNQTAGQLSALLFAFSPLMVEYGRTMFNSYFITGFTIFSLWAISGYFKSQKVFWLLLSGLFAGISVQANFLSVGIFFGLLVFLFLEKARFKKIVFLISGFILGILPYLIFELRHKFFNTNAFFSLLGEGKAVGGSLFNYPAKFVSYYFKSIYFLIGGGSFYLSVFIFILGTIFYLIRTQRKNILFKTVLLFTFLELGVVSLYPGKMLEHYLGAIYPFIFLLLGLFFQEVFKTKFNYLFKLLFFLLVVSSFTKIDFQRNHGYGMPENWKMDDVKKAGEIIANDASGNFNVAAILDGDTRAYPYRYIIETKGKKPMAVENYPQSDILYVVAGGDGDFVLTYPVWEISSFLPANIDNQWLITKEVSVFKLKKI